MNGYTVSLCRVENTLYYFHVFAENEKDAEQKAWKMYNRGDVDDGDVVHAEEFCHEVTQNSKGNF